MCLLFIGCKWYYYYVLSSLLCTRSFRCGDTSWMWPSNNMDGKIYIIHMHKPKVYTSMNLALSLSFFFFLGGFLHNFMISKNLAKFHPKNSRISWIYTSKKKQIPKFSQSFLKTIITIVEKKGMDEELFFSFFSPGRPYWNSNIIDNSVFPIIQFQMKVKSGGESSNREINWTHLKIKIKIKC